MIKILNGLVQLLINLTKRIINYDKTKNINFSVYDLEPNLNLNIHEYDTLKSNNIKGNVKYINIKEFSAIEKFGNLELSNQISERFINYNNLGFKIEETEFDFNNQVVFKVKYKYDLLGNQIEKVYFDSELKITHGFEKKFNERNQILLKKEFGKNRELIDTTLYTYSNKKLASWQTIDRYNKIEDTYTIKVEKSTMTVMIESVGSNQQHAILYKLIYNNKGKIIEIHFFDCNILSSKLFNEFNNLGQLIKSIYYDKNGQFLNSHIYVLDKKGRIKERKIIDREGKTSRFDFIEYDQIGNIIFEYKLDDNRFIKSKTNYVYDKFDTKKNWGRCIHYSNDKPIKIEIRKLRFNDHLK